MATCRASSGVSRATSTGESARCAEGRAAARASEAAPSVVYFRRGASVIRPTDLRGILRYVPQFREKTFVVAVDGAIVADENFGNILMDVAVLWSLSIRTVLV